MCRYAPSYNWMQQQEQRRWQKFLTLLDTAMLFGVLLAVFGLLRGRPSTRLVLEIDNKSVQFTSSRDTAWIAVLARALARASGGRLEPYFEEDLK